jgi:alpha-N-arabinofuranosidase
LTLTGFLLNGCDSFSPASTASNGNVGSSETKISKTIGVNVDPSAASQSISPFIYGQFIEHIDHCIYNGIWAEMLMDRKFYAPVGEEVSQWSQGEKATLATSVTDHVYSGGYAVKLISGSSIRQGAVNFDGNGSYSGYLYAFGTGGLTISVSKNDQILAKKTLVISSPLTFEKESFDLSVSGVGPYVYTIACSEGEVIIDSVSLMPSNTISGMRKDSLDVLKKLNASFYRWPGGNFVSGYSWKDGIGERDSRSSSRNIQYAGAEGDYASREEMITSDLMNIASLGFYGTIEPNDFGLDEFIAFCRYLGAEPNIVVNAGLGTSQDAADEVSYCNATSGTYASKRPTAEPYKVTYFSIGNEMNGDWQLGYCGLTKYIARHREFFYKMKAVDPSIQIIAVGDGGTSWDREMLSGVGEEMDYLSEHFYSTRQEGNDLSHIKGMNDLVEMIVARYRKLNAQGVRIAFDEYAYDKAELPSRLKDGMGVASALNAMTRNADVVSIACYSSTINVTQGSLTTTSSQVMMQGSGYVLSLYRNYFGSLHIPSSIEANDIASYFDINCALSSDKKTLTMSVINAGSGNVKLTNPLFKGNIIRDAVIGKFLDSYNENPDEEIAFSESTVNDCIAPARSVCIFRISL